MINFAKVRLQGKNAGHLGCLHPKNLLTPWFYLILEADPDPKLAEVRKVIEIYKTPPPVPKRNDSIACNIEKYFNTDLIKKGEEDDGDNMELIEERILAEDEPEQSDATPVEVCDTDDQFEVWAFVKSVLIKVFLDLVNLNSLYCFELDHFY